MSDTTLIATEDSLKGTAFYERKVSDNNYGATSAGLYVQFDIDPASGDAEILANARDAFVKAKSTVLDQLGIGFDVTEDGTVRELSALEQVQAVLPVAAVESVPAPNPVAAGEAWYGKRGNPPKKNGELQYVNGRDPWDVLAEDPQAFYDNRPKKAAGEFKPNSPDFKHKDTGIGLWLS